MILGLDIVATQSFGTGSDSTPVVPGVGVVECPAISVWTDAPRDVTTTEECNQ